MHAGQACVVKEDNISERVYTIREGDTLVLQCLVTGHPRPQVSPWPGLSRPLLTHPALGSEEAVGAVTRDRQQQVSRRQEPGAGEIAGK